jgi:hypothetical protein
MKTSLLIVLGLALVIPHSGFGQRSGNSPSNANRKNYGSAHSIVSNNDADDARQAVDSASVIEAEATLFLLTMEDITTRVKRAQSRPTAEQVAAYIVAHASQNYSPAGCVNASLNGATTVVLNFNDCTGRRGLRQLTGTLVETVSVDSGGIQIRAAASELAVGQTTMDIDSTSVWTNNAGTRSLSVTTSGSGTGALGNTFVRQGNYIVSWASDCVTTNGAWSLSSNEGTRSTTAQLTRCSHHCPSGTITRTHGGRTITISFDGSALAEWSSSDGQSGTVNLVCTP